jgi:hypothetical protein
MLFEISILDQPDPSRNFVHEDTRKPNWSFFLSAAIFEIRTWPEQLTRLIPDNALCSAMSEYPLSPSAALGIMAASGAWS